MCEIPNGGPMGHSSFQQLNHSRDKHIYSELVEDNTIDALLTAGGHPISNQFWQYTLCLVHWLSHPDELLQLLLGSVKDLVHWLLKYLKAWNVKVQFQNWFTSVQQYASPQHFSKPVDSLRSGTWHDKEICGMIRTLAVNCAPILVCSKDDQKTVFKTASNEMVMGAEWALREFAVLVSQDHSDLSLKALDDAHKWFYLKKCILWEQRMLKSAKAKVDDLLAKESHQLCKLNIHQIHATMATIVYGAEKVSTTQRRQFQLHPNRAQQVATTWSDADHPKAIKRLENEIYRVAPVKHKHFDKSSQHHEQQLFHEVGTKAPGARSIFAKSLALIKVAAEDGAYGAGNMINDSPLRFRICLSDAEREAKTWSLADTDRITNQLEREIYGITTNEQMHFKKEFSIRLIEFEAWWVTIAIQELQKTVELCIVHFGHSKRRLLSPISDSIWQMGSGANFCTNISEQVDVANMREVYRFSNKVTSIWQMLKHNDWCTGFDYMEKTLWYLALQGWYDIDFAKVLNLLSTTD